MTKSMNWKSSPEGSRCGGAGLLERSESERGGFSKALCRHWPALAVFDCWV